MRSQIILVSVLLLSASTVFASSAISSTSIPEVTPLSQLNPKLHKLNDLLTNCEKALRLIQLGNVPPSRHGEVGAMLIDCIEQVAASTTDLNSFIENEIAPASTTFTGAAAGGGSDDVSSTSSTNDGSELAFGSSPRSTSDLGKMATSVHAEDNVEDEDDDINEICIPIGELTQAVDISNVSPLTKMQGSSSSAGPSVPSNLLSIPCVDDNTITFRLAQFKQANSAGVGSRVAGINWKAGGGPQRSIQETVSAAPKKIVIRRKSTAEVMKTSAPVIVSSSPPSATPKRVIEEVTSTASESAHAPASKKTAFSDFTVDQIAQFMRSQNFTQFLKGYSALAQLGQQKNPTSDDSSLFEIAVRENVPVRFIKILICDGNFVTHFANGQFALDVAVENNNFEIFSALIALPAFAAAFEDQDLLSQYFVITMPFPVKDLHNLISSKLSSL